jgi:serine/threonine protein kinase
MQVFRARCESEVLVPSEVAIKVVTDTEDCALREAFQASLANEWSVSKSLGWHPNVMCIMDRVIMDRPWCLDHRPAPTVAVIMPLFKAGDLATLSLSTRGQSGLAFELKQTLKLFCDMLCGLSHMHAHGYVHGDLKPGNILLAGDCVDDYTAVLSDFGMTSMEGTQKSVAGTTAYNAPEVRPSNQLQTASLCTS